MLFEIIQFTIFFMICFYYSNLASSLFSFKKDFQRGIKIIFIVGELLITVTGMVVIGLMLKNIAATPLDEI
jgi:hypothetical protein